MRKHAGREAVLVRLRQLTAELVRQRPDVVAQATVYRAVLVPPAPREFSHLGRYDVAVLVETRSCDVLDQVRTSAPFEQMRAEVAAAATDVQEMAAGCVRYLGAVVRSRPGLFLFNHFVGADADTATSLWEHLAGWYTAETGLSNSMLLAPTGPSDFVLVNHARWDTSVLRLAVEQFGKRTFRSYVRANLRANHVVALPVLYRLA